MMDISLALPDIGGLAHVVQTVQLAIAPVFLLAGIGSILNVLSTRLARVVDRVRTLEALDDDAGPDEYERHAGELAALHRRISLASDAIFLCVASAIIVCGVVAVLFVARLIGFPLGDVIALMFITAMALLVLGLVLFSIEVRVATRALNLRKLQRKRK
jgi:hypothetical protein